MENHAQIQYPQAYVDNFETVPATLKFNSNTEKISAARYKLDSKLELHGRIQQLLIQKMILTEKCNIWKQRCFRLHRRLTSYELNSIGNATSPKANNLRRRSLKWIESEVLGI